MQIDWSVAGEIVKALVIAAGSIGLSRLFERRSKLIAYFGHVSAFTLPNNPSPTTVHTHAVVVRNSGKRAAHNVRLAHRIAPPNVSVFPQVAYTLNPLPGGGAELHIPILVPGEQVTVSYLYFPPLTFDQISGMVKSDEGIAREIIAIPTPQLPRWQRLLLQSVLVIGIATVLYVLYEIAEWVAAQV